MTLEQQLRKARLEENDLEVSRIKALIGGITRNVTIETILNKSGQILRVKQSYVLVDYVDQEETKDIETII